MRFEFLKENGRIHKSKEFNKMNRYIDTLPDAEYYLDIKQITKIRSLKQNNMYRGMLGLLAREWGYVKNDQLNYFFKNLFKYDLPFILIEKKAGPEEFSSSAVWLTTQINEMCEKIRLWVSVEYNINLPTPEEWLAMSDEERRQLRLVKI